MKNLVRNKMNQHMNENDEPKHLQVPCSVVG